MVLSTLQFLLLLFKLILNSLAGHICHKSIENPKQNEATLLLTANDSISSLWETNFGS